MTEREYEEATAVRARRREPEPAAPVRPGSREWASAVGSAAVARLARQRMVAREEAEAVEEEAEAPEGAELAPEEEAGLEALPEDDTLPE